MARNPFGGTDSAWTFHPDGDDNATLGTAVVTCWTDKAGGEQYTDLAQDEAGTEPITQVVSADGTGDDELGQIPEFWGPDGVTEMWAQADAGPARVKVVASNAAKIAQAQAGAVDALENRADNIDLLLAFGLFQITGDDSGVLPAARPDELAGRRVLFINDSAPSADISSKNDVWIGRPL